MKLLRRLGTIFLVATLIFSTVSYAKYDKQARGRSKKYIKKFQDVGEEYSWANPFIEKMAQKKIIVGDNKGRFNPRSKTTYMESIVMALRIMGWEEDAKKITILPDNYEGKKIPTWGIGYFTYAIEKGIIKEEEIRSFNPNAAAKRYHVAKYIIRALGKEDYASDFDDDIEFKDVQGLSKEDIRYIKAIAKLKLMIGYKGKFNPNGKLTRAEMATLFSRLDDMVENEQDDIEIGLLDKIEEELIYIKQKSEVNEYELDDNVLVLNDNNNVDLDEIKVGTKLKLSLVDDKVVCIEVIEEEKIDNVVIGKVKEIVISDGEEIVEDLESKREEVNKKITEKRERMEEIKAKLENRRASLEEKKAELKEKRELMKQKHHKKDKEDEDIEDVEEDIEEIEEEVEEIEEEMKEVEEELIEESNELEEELDEELEEDEQEAIEKATKYSTIKIEIDNKDYTFKISNNVKVTYEKEEKTLEYISIDDTVKLVLDRNKFVTNIIKINELVEEELEEEEEKIEEEIEEVVENTEEETEEKTEEVEENTEAEKTEEVVEETVESI
jgi:hypothetical protein